MLSCENRVAVDGETTTIPFFTFELTVVDTMDAMLTWESR
jgi:hypothetical protein